jgi:hypothetical protein
MFAHIERGQIIVAVLASLAIVSVVTYFSEGRTAGTSLNPSSLKTSLKHQ